MVPSDISLAMAELSADMVFGKIPEERYLYYIESSLKAGKETAKKCIGKSAEELYKDFDAEIVREKEIVRVGGIELRAQTVTEKGIIKVHIYEDSILNLVENSAWEGEKSLDFETALYTHLFHELFHVLEEKNKAYVSDLLDSVVTWKLFSFSGKSHVVRCSEIAAHSFAKEMLGLPWLPNFYDYIYLKNQKRLSETQFIDYFDRMQALVEVGGERMEGCRA